MGIIQELVARVDQLERTIDRLADFELVPFNIGCRVYNDANISISDSTITSLTFNSERFDTDSMHSTTTNTGRITFNTAGKYLIWANVRWDITAGGIRQALIRLSGSTVLAIFGYASVADGTAGPFINLSTIYDMAVGDYVELRVYQSSGGALNITSVSANSPEFAAWRLA